MVFLRTAFLALAIIAQAVSAYAGTYEDGLAAYKSFDYAAALKFWQPLSERGDTRAQHRLGVIYANGYGVPKDEAEAVKWFRMAAEQGHTQAQFDLGIMYENGFGVPKDEVEAERWNREAGSRDGSIEKPLPTRCHMNQCRWALIIRKRILKENQKGKLIEVIGIEGYSYYGAYDENILADFNFEDIEFIEWEQELYTFHVFCSPRIPTIMFNDGLDPLILDFSLIGGVHESAANIYTIACHNEKNYAAWHDEAFLTKYGYGKPIMENLSIDSPFDIFNYIDDDDIKGNCLLKINNIDYISGECDISIMDDGSFIVSHVSQEKYFAYVFIDKPGEANGWWNEGPYASHAHTPLGKLFRHGACWENDSAKVCAWR